MELVELLRRHVGLASGLDVKITEPENIESLWRYFPMEPTKNALPSDTMPMTPEEDKIMDITERDIAKRTLVSMANNMLLQAATEKASDIHMEPKEDGSVVRFRVDGVLREAFVLSPSRSPWSSPA